MCPTDIDTQMCEAWWFGYMENTFYYVAPPASAVLVIASALLTAPSSRLAAMWGVFGAGAVVALIMAGGNVFWPPFFLSVAAGLSTAFLLPRWHDAT